MTSKAIKDGIAYLMRDHRKVDNLFHSFKSTNVLSERRNIVQELAKELSTHAAIEEQILYPMVQTRLKPEREGVQLAEHSLKMHSDVKDVLYEIENMSDVDPMYEAKVLSLEEMVNSHVYEEENDIFPRLRHALTEEELSNMESALKIASQVAPTHAHPGAPQRPPANFFTTPLTGAWDKIKDTFSSKK